MEKNVLKYIVIFVSIMFLVGCGNNTGSGIIDGNSKIKIVKNEVSNIKLEEYSSDVFSMKKPVGWKVETGGEGIYYAIRVYDEADTRNQIFLMPKMQPMLKSDTAKKQWVYYNSLSGGQHRLFAEAVVLNKATTEEFYKQFNNVASFMKNIDNSFYNEVLDYISDMAIEYTDLKDCIDDVLRDPNGLLLTDDEYIDLYDTNKAVDLMSTAFLFLLL